MAANDQPAPAPGPSQLLGVALQVRDLTTSVAFYTTLLGLQPVERPGHDATLDGTWLGVDDGPVVALVASPGPREEALPSPWGRLVLAVPDATALAVRLADADYWVGDPQLVDHLGETHTIVRTYDPDGHVVDLVERARSPVP